MTLPMASPNGGVRWTVIEKVGLRCTPREVREILHGHPDLFVPLDGGVWCVPVWLVLPNTGPLGQVGTLDVDAQTGAIPFTQEVPDEIAERGNELAQRSPSPAE